MNQAVYRNAVRDATQVHRFTTSPRAAHHSNQLHSGSSCRCVPSDPKAFLCVTDRQFAKRLRVVHLLKSGTTGADLGRGGDTGCAKDMVSTSREHMMYSRTFPPGEAGWTDMPISAYKSLLRAYQRLTAHAKIHPGRCCVVVSAASLAGICGCASASSSWHKTVGNDTCEVDRISSAIDNPSPPVFHEVSSTASPITAREVSASELIYIDRTLDDVLREAMQHSTVLRDIGGVVLRAPQAVNTALSTRMQEADPRFGMEAALSAFDAQLAASATFNNNDRIYNNNFFSGGATAFGQDLHDYQVELSKRTAAGSLLTLRGVNNYDGNNAPANTFVTAWNSWIEGEVRQPLLQGGGLEFNRIAGPGATPGVYNGVLIAKANADINQHDFTIALTDFVSNVENAYWDLYLAYRELDARKKAMEQSLVVWNSVRAQSKGGSVIQAEEALARQQYYQLKSEVDDALSGRLLPGTQVRNGAQGGTVQAGGGVLSAERRLRLLIGLPSSDGSLIRPSEEPTMANVVFDWDASLHEALTQRAELQKQNVAVRKRELELLASRNFVNPRLDAVGRYRFRGFGDELIGSGNQRGATSASSIGNLATGDQQEWMMGVELTVPIGYRKGHAAVDHAELSLARERIIQKEQQREVISNLSGATADAVRAYQAVQNGLNQYVAAQSYFDALTSQKATGLDVPSDRLLDAQRRLVQSEIQFFRARAEYALSLKNVHYEKGSLLAYKDLRVAGGGSATMLPSSSNSIIEPVPDMPAVPDMPSGSEELPPAEAENQVRLSPAKESVSSSASSKRVSPVPGNLKPEMLPQISDESTVDVPEGAITPFPASRSASSSDSTVEEGKISLGAVTPLR